MKRDDYLLSDFEIEEFDKLYDGTLSEEEYYVLKAKLRLDEALQHKYVVYKLLRNEIAQDARTNRILKERFAAIERKSKKKRFVLFSGITAVLVIFTGVFMATLMGRQHVIYEHYKDTESGLSIRMNNLILGPLDTAMIEMANENFDDALLIMQRGKASDTTKYYTAYCHERVGNYDEAANMYRQLSESTDAFIREKSAFRSVLLKLRAGDKSAKHELELIATNPENMYCLVAQEILASMRK
jgi:tetratricopeptide (TPR) repeat protein